MYRSSVVFTVLCVSIISALAAPLPNGQPPEKRENSGTGSLTTYNNFGACGEWISNSDSIVAISAQMYGNGENCGRWVRVTNTATESTVFALMLDECKSCAAEDLGMSKGAFQHIGDLRTGEIPIAWDFMPRGWSPPS